MLERREEWGDNNIIRSIDSRDKEIGREGGRKRERERERKGGREGERGRERERDQLNTTPLTYVAVSTLVNLVSSSCP